MIDTIPLFQILCIYKTTLILASNTNRLWLRHNRTQFRRCPADVWPILRFSGSAARRPILMTFNYSDNSVSDHLPTVRPPTGISPKWPNLWATSGQRSPGLPAMTDRSPVDHRPEAINRAITGGPPAGHLGITVR